jgi:hypothetical protein
MENKFKPTPKDKLNLYVLIILVVGSIIIFNLDVIDNFLSLF